MSLLKLVENFQPVDPDELLAASEEFLNQYPFDDENPELKGDQRCFLNTKEEAHNPNPYQGAGGGNWKPIYHENAFTEFLPEWKGSIFHKIYENFPLPVARMGLMNMAPRTCYSVHRDGPAAIRYHIAVKTNPTAHWIYMDTKEMVHIPANGRCYEFDASRLHTFANFNKVRQWEERWHLVLNSRIPEYGHRERE